MTVPAEKLRSVLGITDVKFVRGQHTLAIVDSTLADESGENARPMRDRTIVALAE
jgi:hypothetical protein